MPHVSGFVNYSALEENAMVIIPQAALGVIFSQGPCSFSLGNYSTAGILLHGEEYRKMCPRTHLPGLHTAFVPMHEAMF